MKKGRTVKKDKYETKRCTFEGCEENTKSTTCSNYQETSTKRQGNGICPLCEKNEGNTESKENSDERTNTVIYCEKFPCTHT